MKKISTFHLILISTGGMIGSGWLFSPFYGLQTAGTGVLLSWFLTAILTLIIGLSFAEVASVFPIVGGIMRFIGVTHARPLGFIFIVLAWVSYIVYLPLEAQSALQYLGFWVPSLIQHRPSGVTLSNFGFIAALGIMLFLTWLNTQQLSKVATTNSIVSICKLLIPVPIALGMIIIFGKPHNFTIHTTLHKFNLETVLLAITSSGLAFAFAGFQNGLIIANSSNNPRTAIPISIIAPVTIGWIIYSLLSLMFIFCLPKETLELVNGIAPLLGLLSLFGLHHIYTILFIDAIVAPLGTANVYTTVTGKILFSIGREFFPYSWLTKINKNHAPYYALWINFFLGVCFLLPFPTWTQLVNFLSSLTLLSCLSGPLTLIILRQNFPALERKFKLPYPKLIGYLGFASCSYFVYWSGMNNLFYLVLLTLFCCIVYSLIFCSKNPLYPFQKSWFLLAYMITLYGISYARDTNLINFPYDNYILFGISLIFTKIFLWQQIDSSLIHANLQRLKHELEQEG
jgi:amino acid transporter